MAPTMTEMTPIMAEMTTTVVVMAQMVQMAAPATPTMENSIRKTEVVAVTAQKKVEMDADGPIG